MNSVSGSRRVFGALAAGMRTPPGVPPAEDAREAISLLGRCVIWGRSRRPVPTATAGRPFWSVPYPKATRSGMVVLGDEGGGSSSHEGRHGGLLPPHIGCIGRSDVAVMGAVQPRDHR